MHSEWIHEVNITMLYHHDNFAFTQQKERSIEGKLKCQLNVFLFGGGRRDQNGTDRDERYKTQFGIWSSVFLKI